uniref:G-patch domain-containing protein n=1 Tax=Echinostoma caproni TaxID=27848 RepID=A0A183A8R9_9TREM
LVHVHEGHECCGQCDPETVRMAMEEAQVPIVSPNEGESATADADLCDGTPEQPTVFLTAAEIRELERRATLDQLKEQYGVKHRVPLNTETVYRDRAALRRAIEKNMKAAGYVSVERNKRDSLTTRETRPRSPSPSQSPATVTQSVTEPLAEDNRGAKLLSKMGWNPGQGLGKSNHGIVEPISVSQRSAPLAGLGYSDPRGPIFRGRPR